MIIKHLSLTNFRNYGRLDLDVGPSVNVIYGNNAQGKTNIIEAISVASSVTSHRTIKDSEMIKFGCNEYIVEMNCKDEVYDSDVDLKVSYMTEKSEFNDKKTSSRLMSQDGMSVPKISQYIGLCNTVIFAPEDLNLVKGAPVERRKYLNLLISKVSPTYYDLLSRTKRIINQKNTCLKSYGGNIDAADNNALDYWDFSLSDLSADVVLERFKFIELISKTAGAHHSVISGGKEVLKVQYDTITGVNALIRASLDKDGMFNLFCAGTLPEGVYTRLKAEVSEYILGKLRSCRKIDVIKGVSTIGIQRDDLEITLNDLSMKQYSSQGQQRSASLALKLAELEIIRDRVKSSPILLLDDVFSELDEGRRISLLSGMNNAQIFITCTDRKYIEGQLEEIVRESINTKFFRVNSGEVFAEN